jgi:hypothetical protein
LHARGYFDNTPGFSGYGAVFKQVLQRSSSVAS